MRNLGLVLGLLFVASTACKKEGAPSDSTPASAQKPAAAVIAPPTPQQTPTQVADTEGACDGDKEHEGSDCGNMAAEAAEGKGCNQWDEAAEKVAGRDVPKDAVWETLSVTGMTCGGCERRIVAKIGELDGVLAVEADAELGQVRLAMKAGSQLKPVAVERINSLGYKVQ